MPFESRTLAHTANEGPMRIQYKCLVLIFVLSKMKLLFPKQNYNVLPPSSYTHIFPGKYVDRSWEYVNRSQTHECGN